MANDLFPDEAIIDQLLKHMKDKVRSIQETMNEFPNPNVSLRYPALSAFAGTREFRNMAPTELQVDDPVGLTVKTLWNTGDVNYSIQMDLWAGSKKERQLVLGEIFEAVNPNVFPKSFKTERKMGLILELEDYFDALASYDMTDYKFDDSEISSQRREWRATITLIGMTDIIRERKEPAMITPVFDLKVTTGDIDSLD